MGSNIIMSNYAAVNENDCTMTRNLNMGSNIGNNRITSSLMPTDSVHLVNKEHLNTPFLLTD